jgi:16S rRNA processing protein RimM
LKKPQVKTHFILGLVGPPFGLKGFVKVRPFSGETGHFFHLNEITLRKGAKDESRKVAEIMLNGDTLLVRFMGIESPEAAAVLNGAEIIAGREFAAPLNDGEFYVEDLKGLEVLNGEDVLGHINDLVEGGGGFLAEVKLSSGALRFVPYRREFFGEVNLALGTIVLLEPWVLD